MIPILAALTFAGRVFLIMYWFAVGTLVAGGTIWLLVVDRDGIVAAAVTGVLLLLPGVWLLHLQWALRSARRKVLNAGVTGMSLYRSGHLGLLLLPWYWAGVTISALAGLAMIPTAVIVGLMRL